MSDFVVERRHTLKWGVRIFGWSLVAYGWLLMLLGGGDFLWLGVVGGGMERFWNAALGTPLNWLFEGKEAAVEFGLRMVGRPLSGILFLLAGGILCRFGAGWQHGGEEDDDDDDDDALQDREWYEDEDEGSGVRRKGRH